MRRIARSLLASTFVFSMVALPMLGGCVVVMGGCDWQSANAKSEKNLSVAHVAGAGLDVQTENGKVVVRRGGTSEVAIQATVRATTQERADGAKVTAGRSTGADASGANALVVRVDWPEGKREPSEGCSFEITIPETAWVRLNSSNGGITIENLGGTADLKTSNSSIEVKGHQGDVKASTSNGSVRASNVGGSLEANTSNSSMTIADVGGFVKATTSNGTVNISLASNSKGPIHVKTSNGSVNLDLPSGYAGKIDLRTSNGSIKQSGFPNAKYNYAKGHGELQLGEGSEESTVQTSNGSIKVNAR